MSPFGSWDFASKVGGGTTDVQSTSGAAHASPEQQIADQVSVWVSQNVQSAELKMDAFGSDQVEVSITMAGNEATVQFRSDVAETRDLLQRAAANLESALRSDGLVLSGVSVGASTQGQDNAREASQNTQAFSRKPQAKQDATGETGIRMVARPAVAQGRLDLYV
jgi:flagellar hook-length control protein FliK